MLRYAKVVLSIITNMKVELRIPTDPFAYIGLELSDNEVMTETMLHTAISNYINATEAYKRLQGEYKGGEGLTDKEMGMIIENMCMGVTTKEGTELWAKASDAQKKEINRLSRALKRIKNKHEAESHEPPVEIDD